MSPAKRRPVGAALVSLLALLVAACGGEDSGAGDFAPGVSGTVDVSGSSTVEPISVRVAELLSDRNADIHVNVDGPGTGDGFKLFCRGETGISDASRAIKPEEAEDCAGAGIEFVELSIANDGLTVMTSPENEVDCLAKADLYALVGPESEGVDNWEEAAPLARELGSDTAFPDAPLEITAPGEESGTYDAFVELALEKIAEARAEAGELPEEAVTSVRKDYTSQSNETRSSRGSRAARAASGGSASPSPRTPAAP